MKIAVLSDIHGNYIALKKCIIDAKEHNVDRYVFLGDYLGEFPYPHRTLDILYKLMEEENCLFLKGNKEDYWINRRKNINCDWKDGNYSIASMIYNYDNLKESDFDFFESLLIAKRFEIDGHPPILFCHGSPENNSVKLLPNDEKTRNNLDCVKEDIIVCGHTHIEREFLVENKRIINVGAVGVPLVEGGHKAQYMILESYTNEWKIEFRSVEYDISQVVKELHESGLFDMTPYWCRITVHLLKTGKISHGSVLGEVMKANDYNDPWYAIPEEYWDVTLKKMGIE